MSKLEQFIRRQMIKIRCPNIGRSSRMAQLANDYDEACKNVRIISSIVRQMESWTSSDRSGGR